MVFVYNSLILPKLIVVPKLNMSNTQNKIDKAANALMKMPAPKEHIRPIPTKKDLEKKFVMRVDRKGKPSMREVK